MMDFEFSYRDIVRYRDCDMHQHLNHAAYFTFMETARAEYLYALGLPRTPAFDAIPFIVASASCEFRAPAYMGDEIVTAVGVTKIKTKSMVIDYVMTKANDGTLLAEGKTAFVYFDFRAQTTEPIPDDLRAKITALRASKGLPSP
jgi:acyl-CoA thioester hydrolase